jgi:hypothetical protein
LSAKGWNNSEKCEGIHRILKTFLQTAGIGAKAGNLISKIVFQKEQIGA